MSKPEQTMKTLHRKCAGLDVHSAEVAACARKVIKGKVQHEVRRFETTTAGLLALMAWLEAEGVTVIAMEATGVYWKPVWHILEGQFTLVLANAAHVKNLPGRKSDVADAVWLADLLAHGLIRPSMVPPTAVQDLRDLTRTRRQLGRELTQHVQRIQKVLEDANIKLTGLISDVMGQSGRRIIKAMTGGESDPAALAKLGSTRLKCQPAELIAALTGRIRPHHRFMLAEHMAMIDAIEARMTRFEAEIEARLLPFRDTVERLSGIPGVSTTAAAVILAEIGFDMSVFPSDGHLLSWAGLVPRMDESAGKKRSTRLRKGACWLKPLLVQCAWAATRKRGCYLSAQFYRLKGQRGPKKAIMAVAASILQAAYHMIKNGTPYRDLGAGHFAIRDKTKLAASLARRIAALGYDIQYQQAA
jgi:transposase